MNDAPKTSPWPARIAVAAVLAVLVGAGLLMTAYLYGGPSLRPIAGTLIAIGILVRGSGDFWTAYVEWRDRLKR